MKPEDWRKIGIALFIVAIMTACTATKEENRNVNQEQNNSVTPVEEQKEPEKQTVSVSSVRQYKDVDITAWLDETTVVAVKNNEELDPMQLEEFSGDYPRSLYLLNLETEQSELLKEQEDTFLGEASLSPDKKHLLYSEYSLGDPAYYVMDMGTKESFGLKSEGNSVAMSARWSDDNTVVGSSYRGGAYISTVQGSAAGIEGLTEGSLYIVAKWNDKIYYNTGDNPTLMAFDMNTKQSESTNLDQVGDVLFMSDGQRLLVSQYNEDGTKMTLTLADLDGGNSKQLAEGTEISGVSVSPDENRIAYHVTEGSDGTTKGLYIFDLHADQSVEIAADVDQGVTSWSPSGEKLAYSEWNGEQRNSTIVDLAY